MKHKRFLTTALALLIVSCSKTGVDPDGGDVEIRIRNGSQSPFSSVQVGFPQANVDYGAIDAGNSSAYQRVAEAYRYAAVVVRIGSTEQRIRPIDYVGEKVLEPGRYTYILYFSSGYLQLEMVKDQVGR